MQALESAVATSGTGLEGDRYALGIGTYSDRGDTGRAITLIAREDVDAVNAAGEVTITPGETRRNLVTEGIALEELIGRSFRIGEVVLHACRAAPPCKYLEGLTQPGVLRALQHRAGIRADVVRGGVLRVGDEIVEIEVAEEDARG
jgi:MOSC domain-containing protein YiiM